MFRSLALICLVSCFTVEATGRDFYTYGFGGLEKLSPVTVTGLLEDLDYLGLALPARGAVELRRLKRFQKLSEKSGGTFEVVSAFMAHRFDEVGFDDTDHRNTIDLLAGTQTQLWVFFRDDDGDVTEDQLEAFIRPIFDYALEKDVELVLYPHKNNIMATAQDAFRMAERIDPSLGIVFNLTHELNAGKGDPATLRTTFTEVESRVVAVTISGANKTTNIVPLHKSTYNLKPFIRIIKDSSFDGPVGFLNHKLSRPDIYLKKSKKRWVKLYRKS